MIDRYGNYCPLISKLQTVMLVLLFIVAVVTFTYFGLTTNGYDVAGANIVMRAPTAVLQAAMASVLNFCAAVWWTSRKYF